MNMTSSILRTGNFTSSEIGALNSKGKQSEGFGVPAITYIKKKNRERRLGRSISTEIIAKPTSWGTLLEPRVFDILPTAYSLNSDETLQHPAIPYWVGSPDGFKYDHGKTVIDFKCPYTLESFCDLVDPLYEGLTGIEAINAIRKSHDKGETYYQQLVSNSIISNSKFAELIVYMPYEDELEEIKQSADGESPYYWIWAAKDGELPYLKKGGYYKNLNIIRFEVPQEDKDLLTENVIKAGKMLIDRPSVIIAEHDNDLDVTIIKAA